MPERLPRRPSQCTVVVTEAIAANIEAGNTLEHAAVAAGISRDTFYKWLRQGEDERVAELLALGEGLTEEDLPPAVIPSKRYFYERITLAKSLAISKNIEIIKNAATTDWKAAAWMLAKLDRGHYGSTAPLDPSAGPSALRYASPKAELEARLHAIRERMAQGHVPFRERPTVENLTPEDPD